MIGWLEILSIITPIIISLVVVFIKMYTQNIVNKEKINNIESRIEHMSNNQKQRELYIVEKIEEVKQDLHNLAIEIIAKLNQK